MKRGETTTERAMYANETMRILKMRGDDNDEQMEVI